MKAYRYILALLLLASVLICAVGCSGYAPVASTEEEMETVLTLDGGTYEVPYELYRFYFLSELAQSNKRIENLNDAEKAAFLNTLRECTLEELCTLYAVFSLSAAHGIDPYDKEMDDMVDEGIVTAVEGDDVYLGYGDFDSYLAAIKAANMNDSVFRFLLRYQYAEARLGAALRDRGTIAADADTVRAYIRSDDCVRVSWIYISYAQVESYTEQQFFEMEQRAKMANDEDFLKMTHQVLPDTYSDAELDDGFYIGKYQLDPYYQTLTDAVFSLEEGETSHWVESGDGRYLVRRLPKDEAYMADEANLADFTEYYLLNTFYRMLYEESVRLRATVVTLPVYEGLTFDRVKMPDKES